jgi:hypothetical protein
MGWLVAADRRADLESFLVWLDGQPAPLPTREVGGRLVVDHPYAEEPGLPAELLSP